MFNRKSVEAQIEEANRNAAPDLKILTLKGLDAELERLTANVNANAEGNWDRADIEFRDRILDEIEARKQEGSKLEKEKAA
jgi:hypothetical protein